MRDSDVNLYRQDRLREEFGPFLEEPGSDGTAIAANDIVGAPYRRLLAETTAIVSHQWLNEISRSALKGFLFHGGVGIGKTTMARRLAYELSRIFGAGTTVTHDHDGESHSHPVKDDVVLVTVDGADIARGRYGDSEAELRKLFQFAREGEYHLPAGRHGGHPPEAE